MIATLEEAKAHLNIVTADDDTLVESLIERAQAHLETLVGYEIEEEFEEPPADLKQAVLLLTAHWYENREASLVGVSAGMVPVGVWDIVGERRNYSW